MQTKTIGRALAAAAIAISSQSQAFAQVVIVTPPVAVRKAAPDTEAAWRIMPETAEIISDGAVLKKKATVLRQRLVPMQLATLHGDVVRADGGDRWAASGDQLFGAKVGDLDALCVIKTKLNLTVGMFFLPKTSEILKQDCFVDSDADGKLDQRFEADPGIGVLPNVARAKPRALQPLTPVSYSIIDPSQFADESWVEIRYRGDGIKAGKPARFEIRYRYDGKTRDITQDVLAQAEEGRQILTVLGARIVVNTMKDSTLVAKVERNMDADFGIQSYLVAR